jgi:hypothetical protein
MGSSRARWNGRGQPEERAVFGPRTTDLNNDSNCGAEARSWEVIECEENTVAIGGVGAENGAAGRVGNVEGVEACGAQMARFRARHCASERRNIGRWRSSGSTDSRPTLIEVFPRADLGPLWALIPPPSLLLGAILGFHRMQQARHDDRYEQCAEDQVHGSTMRLRRRQRNPSFAPVPRGLVMVSTEFMPPLRITDWVSFAEESERGPARTRTASPEGTSRSVKVSSVPWFSRLRYSTPREPL